MPFRHITNKLLVVIAAFCGASLSNAQNLLYPDMFPFVDVDAPSSLQTLQNWSLSGNEIRFNTLFANQGDGLFEIRRGASLGPDTDELLQRVYIDTDAGTEFQDFVIGETPVPGSPNNPNPNLPYNPSYATDPNVLFLEDFTTFSLHEAPVVEGLITVGEEVASDTKTSWRLVANRGPLPGFDNPPRYTTVEGQASQQRISVGWADLYGAGSNGQFIDITGVTAGPLYWLRQTVDPTNKIMETDETNNSFEILIDLNNPGEALTFAGEFIQPGDAAPGVPGDLTGDGQIDLSDWLAFKAGATVPLAGLDPADALALGDLNLDGEHTISDVVLFRSLYDEANGLGAFSQIQSVPEPSSAMIAIGIGTLLSLGSLGRCRRIARTALVGLALAAFVIASSARVTTAQSTIFFEDFEGLPLQDAQSFSEIARDDVWTSTPPSGWTRDNRTTPSGGPVEFFGWTFVDRNWWISTAGDQQRSSFTNASGTVAVADPDEYDDIGNIDPDQFTASLSTPAIDVTGLAPGSVRLKFDSSWRPEDTQEAALFASIDGAAPVQIFNWTSSGADFKPNAPNETISVGASVTASGQTDYAFDLNPAGASTVRLLFDMPRAGNDWWWAVDNIELFVPPTLTVDIDTGEMTITGGQNLTGYQITSQSGSLDAQGWTQGNLDSQNFGSPSPMTADFNNDGVINSLDYTIFRENFGIGSEGDANGDGITDSVDYTLFGDQFGSSVAPGESWETIIAQDNQVLEFFLDGSSTFSTASVGEGYDTQQGATDLKFTYSTDTGAEFEGEVVYTTSNTRSASVPEPTSQLLLSLTMGASLLHRCREAA